MKSLNRLRLEELLRGEFKLNDPWIAQFLPSNKSCLSARLSGTACTVGGLPRLVSVSAVIRTLQALRIPGVDAEPFRASLQLPQLDPAHVWPR